MKAVILALMPMMMFGSCTELAAWKAMRRELFEPATARLAIFPAPAGQQAKAPPVICGRVTAKNHHGHTAVSQKFVVDRRTGQAAFQNDVILDKKIYPVRGDWPREARFLKEWDAVCGLGALSYPQVRQAFDWRRSPEPSQMDWSQVFGKG
jgi:hypothetical protein